ncbi:MAG: hypothetical protein GY765_42045 [bacterium]|nr:hypothetical protein [bacterium]
MNDNNESTIFDEYAKEKTISDHLKTPRSWLIMFGILTGIIMLIVFYKSVVLDSMSPDEVSQSIEIILQDTNWVQKDVNAYGVKIVPTISFKVKNNGSRSLQYVGFEGVFVMADTGKVHTDGAAQVFKEPLEPGQTSDVIYIKAFFGYSASSMEAFMNNKKEWKKMQAKLYARTRGSGSVQVGDSYPIKQQIDGYVPKEAGRSEGSEGDAFQKFGKDLQITSQNSIWVDRAKSASKVVIVPSFTFQIKNIGDTSIGGLIFKGEFYFEDNGEKLSDGMVSELKKELLPNDESNEISIRSQLGYEATSKEAFVRNTKTWRKVKTKLYAKQKDSEYVLLGTYSIRQEIQGIKVVYTLKEE